MGVILDTSVVIEAERRESEILAFAANRPEEVFGISVITVAELLHGVHRADSARRRIKRSAFVEKVIEHFPVYSFETAGARIYAQLWAELLRKGIRIGAHDLIIGATALALGFSVATFDRRHFEMIDGLELDLLVKS